MPVDTLPFPPGAPSISGDQLTISTFLNYPPYVQRAITDLAGQRFLADMMYGNGPAAPGGAVQYDQATAVDLFLNRDVHPIRPLGEYPILSDQIPTPLIAPTAKWGGRVQISDEDIRRNRIDVVRRALIKLRNTIVRKVDAVALATLAASPHLSYAFSGVWSNSGTDIFAGLEAARLLVDVLDMGYEIDTLILNPTQGSNLLSRSDVRIAFGPTAQESIVRGASIGRILNMDVYYSNRLAAGTGWALQRGVVGGISDEVPLASKTYHQDDSDKTWVQASRVFVPYVTDPKAAVYLTGM